MNRAALVGVGKSGPPIRRYSSWQLRKLNQPGMVDERSLAKIESNSLLRKNILVNPSVGTIPSTPPLLARRSGIFIKPNVRSVNTLNAGLINARSAIKNAAAIHDLIFEQDLDMLALTETWFSAASPPRLDELVPDGYKIISLDRQSRRGGGVALIFRKHLDFSIINSDEIYASLECLSLRWNKGPEETIGVIIIYHPPSARTSFPEDMMELISNVALQFTKSLILGDFNCWADDVFNLEAQQILRFSESVGYTQEVSDPTHKAGHILDWILHSGCVHNVDAPLQVAWSDHCYIGFKVEGGLERKAPHIPNRRTTALASRNYSNISVAEFSQRFLATMDATTFFGTMDVSEKVMMFNQVITETLDYLAPRKLIHNVRPPKSNPSWYNQDTRALKWKCRSAEKAWRKNPNDESRLAYTSTLRLYKLEIKKAKRSFLTDKIKN